MEVVRLSQQQIIPLRMHVLRRGTPSQDPTYPEDNAPDTIHLGIVLDNVVVGTSTWLSKESPVAPGVAAMQLKGMAVDDALQGTGAGRLIVDAGLAEARQRHARIVWANARDSALGFYERCGFVTIGDGFMEPNTAMPHHIVQRDV